MNESRTVEADVTWKQAKRLWLSRGLLGWAKPVELLAMKAIRLGRIAPDDPANRALITDISANGIVRPLLVEQFSETEYAVIDGNRRWAAARRLGLRYVPVINVGDGSDGLALRRIAASHHEFEPTEVPAFLSLLETTLGYRAADLADDLGALIEGMPSTHRTARIVMLIQALAPLQPSAIEVLAAFAHAKPLFRTAFLCGTLEESELVKLAREGSSTFHILAEALRQRVEVKGAFSADSQETPFFVRRLRDCARVLDDEGLESLRSTPNVFESVLIEIIAFANAMLKNLNETDAGRSTGLTP